MFIILCIFALWIGWFGHQPIRGKSVTPSILSMTDRTKRTDNMARKKTLAEVKAAFKEVWGDKYIYDQITEDNYVNMNTPVTVVCSKHGCEHSITPSSHIQGIGGCPQCKSENISKKKKGVTLRRGGKVFGVGINDSSSSVVYNDTAYKRWVAMLHRCYGSDFKNLHPTYLDCFVCEEWLRFSNFKKWFDENYVEGYHLDKDILIKGNKVYSPDTCCFVPPEINKLLLTNNGMRNGIIGSAKKGNKWEVFIRIVNNGNRSRKHLGYFNTPEEAFYAYASARESYIQEVATQYYKDGKITEKVYNALVNYKVEITD